MKDLLLRIDCTDFLSIADIQFVCLCLDKGAITTMLRIAHLLGIIDVCRLICIGIRAKEDLTQRRLIDATTTPSCAELFRLRAPILARVDFWIVLREIIAKLQAKPIPIVLYLHSITSFDILTRCKAFDDADALLHWQRADIILRRMAHPIAGFVVGRLRLMHLMGHREKKLLTKRFLCK